MSNATAGNLHFIDTAPASISINNIRVKGLVVRCTHASNAARITLGNDISGTSYPTLFDIEIPAANDFEVIDFSAMPLIFPNGIRIKTMTDCTITLIVEKNTGGN